MYFACFFCSMSLIASTTLAGRSWCPEVGLRFLDLTSCDRSEVESRIPNPTSGRLERVTCLCPEVGLGILFSSSSNPTSGHLKVKILIQLLDTYK